MLSWIRNAVLFGVLGFNALPASALYFYIDGSTPKCFFEELPKDTLVVGRGISAAYLGQFVDEG